MNIRRVRTRTPLRCVKSGMHEQDYFACCGLNPSTIVHRRKSALAAKFAYEEDRKDTGPMAFGRCCHSLLFEPDRFEDNWAVWPDKPKRGKEYKEFVANAKSEGKQVIKDGFGYLGFGHVVCCVRAAIAKPGVRDLVAEGESEVAVFSADHGLQTKGKIDRIDTRGGNIIDAKFTNDIHAPKFGRSAASFGYHVKMACYREWFRRETGKQVNGVYLITVETAPPYDVAVVPVTDLHLEDGWAQADELIGQIAMDIVTNRFHGVDGGEKYYPLELPYWAMMEANADVEF